MANEPTLQPRFQFRFLLESDYVGTKLKEIRSAEDFLHRTKNLGRYVLGLLAGLCWEIRGIPRGVYARAERAFFELRGELIPGIWHDPAPAAASLAEFHRPEILARQAALAEQFSAGKPFKHVVIDGFFLPEFCRRLAGEFPKPAAVRFFDEWRPADNGRREELAELGASFAALDRCFQSAEFLALMSRITGIPDLRADPKYLGGGTHEELAGAESDPHVDFTLHPESGLHRRVTLFVYLNPEWNESWGGALELHFNPRLPANRNPVQTILPLFNRCVIFENGDRSWHGFKSIRLPPEKLGLPRRSIAAYFYTREEPRETLAIPSDLSVSVDRPLPPEFKPGRTLTEEDVRLISRLIAGRDWKLEYLYGRAIGLFNQWRAVKAELEKVREASAK